MTERAVRARVEFHSSRIVVADSLRKPSTPPTPCFVEHRSQKQLSVVFVSLTRNPLQRNLGFSRGFLLSANEGARSRSGVENDTSTINNFKLHPSRIAKLFLQ